MNPPFIGRRGIQVMKKLFIFAVALMSVAAQAFGFSFAEVTRVAQVGNSFIAYAGSESVDISALQYTQMQNADGYYILSVDGKKVVAAADEFTVERLTVDSVGLENGQPKVFFTNGSHKVFTKAEWLKALKGQTVRRAYLNIPTWEWENYATVAESDVVVYHKAVVTASKTKTAPQPDALPVKTAPEQKVTPQPEVKPQPEAKPATKTDAPSGSPMVGFSYRIIK